MTLSVLGNVFKDRFYSSGWLLEDQIHLLMVLRLMAPMGQSSNAV